MFWVSVGGELTHRLEMHRGLGSCLSQGGRLFQSLAVLEKIDDFWALIFEYGMNLCLRDGLM